MQFGWYTFCDWYWSRPRPTRSARRACAVLTYVLDTFVRLMHPIAPFVTEEIAAVLRPERPVDRRLARGRDAERNPARCGRRGRLRPLHGDGRTACATRAPNSASRRKREGRRHRARSSMPPIVEQLRLLAGVDFRADDAVAGRDVRANGSTRCACRPTRRCCASATCARSRKLDRRGRAAGEEARQRKVRRQRQTRRRRGRAREARRVSPPARRRSLRAERAAPVNELKELHELFAASVGAAAALIGLLFVAVSVAPEQIFGRDARAERTQRCRTRLHRVEQHLFRFAGGAAAALVTGGAIAVMRGSRHGTDRP